MKNKTRILFVGHDRGGCAAIQPVYQKLRAMRGVSVRFLIKTSAKDLRRAFDSFQPTMVMVGTSAGMSSDKLATIMATERGIPSVAVIDFSGNYQTRFCDPGSKKWKYLPTWITAIDEEGKREMVKEGLPAERIVVTGNPAFEAYRLIPPPKKNALLFLSQPYSELGKDVSFGYDEKEVLGDLLDALEILKVRERLTINFHPRERMRNKYDAMIKHRAFPIRKNLRLLPIEKMLGEASIVLGMNSTVLFEASLTGRKVLSYQPHLTKTDPLRSNRMGISMPVYRKKDLVSALRRLIQGKRSASVAAARKKYVLAKPTQNVVRFLRKQKFL